MNKEKIGWMLLAPLIILLLWGIGVGIVSVFKMVGLLGGIIVFTAIMGLIGCVFLSNSEDSL